MPWHAKRKGGRRGETSFPPVIDRGAQIRTGDLSDPNGARYQAAPHPERPQGTGLRAFSVRRRLTVLAESWLSSSVLAAVLFDVDFTLFRPGPELGPEGYRRLGERHGLVARPGPIPGRPGAAIEELQRQRELVHDDEIWIVFTEQIVLGMGGEPAAARACAIDMVRQWERHENFSLYEDALPVLDELRRHGLLIGLVTNGQRDLEEFVAHHGLEVDAMVGSRAHGRIKPHPSIFEAALDALGVEPEEAAMVGDSYEDDIEGARALGVRAILLDRDGLHVDAEDRIDTLLALPAALGLSPT